MKKMVIRWQRLLDDGQTCPRCGSTEAEVERAVSVLGQTLKPLSIDVVLEKGESSVERFKLNTLQSNAIWLNGRLLEDWPAGGCCPK